jgi:hypothetical protein
MRLVREPGKGVVEVRAAITEAKGSTVVLDQITTIIPQAAIISGGVGLAAGSGGFAGGASIEVEIRDSITFERLMAGVDRRHGGKSMGGVFKTWDDVMAAFRFWAEAIVADLHRRSEG